MRILLVITHICTTALQHQKKFVFVLFILLAASSTFAVRRVPNKYTSSALFNFHSDFSKVPASSEFFSEIYDPNELRAEKEAILLGVLSDDFLSEMTKNHLDPEDAKLEWKVQGLRKDIRFVPLSRTTYQLIVEQRSAESAQLIAWDILDRLEETLRTDRLVRMQSVFGSVTQQLRELTVQEADKDLSIQMDAARRRIEAEMTALERKYTAEHPRLARLRSQLNSLYKPSQYDPHDPLGRGQIENWASLRGILLTRQAMLQVAIRMEEKGTLSHIKIVKEPDLPRWPSSPKRNVLYVSAAITALALSFASVALANLLKDLLVLFPELERSWSTFRKSLRKKTLQSERNSEV